MDVSQHHPHIESLLIVPLGSKLVMRFSISIAQATILDEPQVCQLGAGCNWVSLKIRTQQLLYVKLPT